jgi:hypothetical protein
VTVELARRLIESGLPLLDIEAALLLVVERGLSLPEALAEQDAGLLSRVDQELARSELPSVLTVRASPEVVARLPAGMCRRLMAVPVHVDPRTGRVDVAAVEPLDGHTAQEFAYHLEQPVRVLHASLEAVRTALDGLQRGAKVSRQPGGRGALPLASDAPIPLIKTESSTGSDAPIPLVKLDSSATRSEAPPIPLVRRTLEPGRAPSPQPSLRSAPPAGAFPEAEGVALSWRSKPLPVDLVAGAEGERRAAAAREPSAPPAPAALSTRERLEEATSPEAVLDLLRDCLAPAASIVFQVRNASFDGRVASPDVEARAKVKQISLLSHQPSVLETAVKSGFYLGPIPNTPNHRELRDALPADASNEVYATVVTVSDRPSLVWLLAGFEQSLDLTRRADEIALVAGRVLARILRQRKRGG